MITALVVITLLVPPNVRAGNNPVEDKDAALITDRGLTEGYSFGYPWNLSIQSIGDKTMYPGQPCKAEFHVGPFPLQSHMNIQPFAVLHLVPEWRLYSTAKKGT